MSNSQDFGSKLGSLDMTEDEIKRFSKAFQDPQFKKLFAQYANEISDPNQRARYEEEITQMEKQQGVDIEFVHPKPGFVFKSRDSNDRKFFVNIAQSEAVAPPESSISSGSNKKGLNWSLPHCFSPVRSDVDKQGNNCSVIDVVFHPKTLLLASSDTRFRDMIVEVAIDGIRDNFSFKLDRTNVKLPKMEFKGVPTATTIRKKDGKIISSGSNTGREYAKKYQKDFEEQLGLSGKASKRNFNPHYEVVHRNYTDMQNYALDKLVADTRPTELIVKIDLPGISAAKDIELDIFSKTVQICDSSRSKETFTISLPFEVNTDGASSAKFDKGKSQLTLTLPVQKKVSTSMTSGSADESSKNNITANQSEEKSFNKTLLSPDNSAGQPQNNTLLNAAAMAAPKPNDVQSTKRSSEKFATNALKKDSAKSMSEIFSSIAALQSKKDIFNTSNYDALFNKNRSFMESKKAKLEKDSLFSDMLENSIEGSMRKITENINNSNALKMKYASDFYSLDRDLYSNDIFKGYKSNAYQNFSEVHGYETETCVRFELYEEGISRSSIFASFCGPGNILSLSSEMPGRCGAGTHFKFMVIFPDKMYTIEEKPANYTLKDDYLTWIVRKREANYGYWKSFRYGTNNADLQCVNLEPIVDVHSKFSAAEQVRHSGSNPNDIEVVYNEPIPSGLQSILKKSPSLPENLKTEAETAETTSEQPDPKKRSASFSMSNRPAQLTATSGDVQLPTATSGDDAQPTSSDVQRPAPSSSPETDGDIDGDDAAYSFKTVSFSDSIDHTTFHPETSVQTFHTTLKNRKKKKKKREKRKKDIENGRSARRRRHSSGETTGSSSAEDDLLVHVSSSKTSSAEETTAADTVSTPRKESLDTIAEVSLSPPVTNPSITETISAADEQTTVLNEDTTVSPDSQQSSSKKSPVVSEQSETNAASLSTTEECSADDTNTTLPKSYDTANQVEQSSTEDSPSAVAASQPDVPNADCSSGIVHESGNGTKPEQQLEKEVSDTMPGRIKVHNSCAYDLDLD